MVSRKSVIAFLRVHISNVPQAEDMGELSVQEE